MAEMYGLDPDEAQIGITGVRLRELVHPDDRPVLRQRVERLKVAGGLTVLEYRVQPAPDVLRWVLVRGLYEPKRLGERIMPGRGIVIDITESKLDGHAEDRAFFLRTSSNMPDGPDGEDANHPVARLCDAALAMKEALHDMRAHADPHEALEACNTMTLHLIKKYLAQNVEAAGPA